MPVQLLQVVELARLGIGFLGDAAHFQNVLRHFLRKELKQTPVLARIRQQNSCDCLRLVLFLLLLRLLILAAFVLISHVV